MNKVSVTIEGASWGEVVRQMEEFVGRADATPPVPINAHQPLIEQEPPHVAETFKPFTPAAESWPVGQCPKHLRPWKQGNFGPYCTAKDETGPKGYCILKPGDIWNAKNIPLMPVSAA